MVRYGLECSLTNYHSKSNKNYIELEFICINRKINILKVMAN